MSETQVMTTTEEVGTALAKPGKTPIEMAERGIMLRSLAELYRFAEMVLQAGAAPRGIDTPGKVAVAVQMGLERGLPPLGGLRAVFFVNGLPSWRGEAAVALVRQSGVCRTYRAWVDGEGDERAGYCETWRAGDLAPVRTAFTVRDAKKAGLWNKSGPWSEYPDRQLKWRAIGFNLRDQFPDVLGGFPVEEELRDYPAEAMPAQQDKPALAPPPATPDPLLAALAKPADMARQSDVDVATATVPGVQAQDAAPEETPTVVGCLHPKVPPSRLKPGKTLVCPDCTEELRGEPVQRELVG